MPKAVGARGSGPNLIIDDFDISDALKSRFRVWQSIFDEQIPPQKMMTADETAYFSAEEFNLALLLSQELGSRGVVEWEMGGFYLLLEAGVAVALYERLPPPSTEEIFGGKFDGI